MESSKILVYFTVQCAIKQPEILLFVISQRELITHPPPKNKNKKAWWRNRYFIYHFGFRRHTAAQRLVRLFAMWLARLDSCVLSDLFPKLIRSMIEPRKKEVFFLVVHFLPPSQP